MAFEVGALRPLLDFCNLYLVLKFLEASSVTCLSSNEVEFECILGGIVFE